MVWAQEKYLKDVPEGHWANEAVYDLVHRGVTGGFPDGTFRGNKKITRNEIASFMSKLAKSFSRQRSQNEKLVAELRTEVSVLQSQKEQRERELKIGGELAGRFAAMTDPGRDGRGDYRLKLRLLKNYLNEASLKINLDTMDTGFNNEAGRSFAGRLIDLEGRFQAGNWLVKGTIGPAKVLHTDTLFPSENYTIFARPNSGLEFSTKNNKLDFSAAYIARYVEPSGLIGVNDFTLKLGYDFGRWAGHLKPRYLYKSSGARDMVADLGLDWRPNAWLETNIIISAGSPGSGLSGWYGKLVQQLKGRTSAVLRLDVVGSNYRVTDLDKYEFVFLNNFDRLILDGTSDLGLTLKHQVSGQLILEGKGDYVATAHGQYGAAYPGTYLLWQVGGAYEVWERIYLAAFYRQFQVPSGVDQFSFTAPTLSEMVGLSLKASF
jgi:hypothetical protein